LQLPADVDKRESNCRVRDPDVDQESVLPSDDCDDGLAELDGEGSDGENQE